MVYCFKNLFMPRKRVAHGWSSPSRGGCLTVKGAESRATLLEQKKHQSCLYFQLCCKYSSNQCKITSVILMDHLSLMSLLVQSCCLEWFYVLFCSSSATHSSPSLTNTCNLINLTRGVRGWKKLERCYSKENIKISLEISTLECS